MKLANGIQPKSRGNASNPNGSSRSVAIIPAKTTANKLNFPGNRRSSTIHNNQAMPALSRSFD
jgi:hypothetical protein